MRRVNNWTLCSAAKSPSETERDVYKHISACFRLLLTRILEQLVLLSRLLQDRIVTSFTRKPIYLSAASLSIQQLFLISRLLQDHIVTSFPRKRIYLSAISLSIQQLLQISRLFKYRIVTSFPRIISK